VFRRLAAGARDTLVVVGHEPDLSAALADLTGGRCRVRKAAVAVLEPVPGGFELVTLLDPSLLRRHKDG
jgi:phosphohistidine phosphatase SixA